MNFSPGKIIWAYIYPTIFFGLNHVGFGLLKGIEYPGGFWVMLGGSTFLGFFVGLGVLEKQVDPLHHYRPRADQFFRFYGGYLQ